MEDETLMDQSAVEQTGDQSDAFLAGMEDKPLEEPSHDQQEETPVSKEVPAPEEPPEAPRPDGENAAADTPAARSGRFQGVEEFARTFPEAYERARKDPNSIPDSVWKAVSQGLSLTAAYARHAVDQAQKETQAAQQNRKNAQRSTGSMRSAGSDADARDAFLAGFEA